MTEKEFLEATVLKLRVVYGALKASRPEDTMDSEFSRALLLLGSSMMAVLDRLDELDREEKTHTDLRSYS